MSFSIDRTRLPSTAALTAFEAAARLGSFTEASRELNLTQGAISRQIKSLEDHLGVILFDRTTQGLQLTDLGRAMADQVRGLLDQFLHAMDAISSSGPNSLTIGILPSIANRWLIPRATAFVREFPEIDLKILTTGREFDIEDTRFDTMLTVGSEFSSDVISHKIGEEDFVATASPDWLAEERVSSVTDLGTKKLLAHTLRPHMWNQWFAINGLPTHKHTRYTYLEHYEMIICAAQSGLGAGLVPYFLIQDDIANGRLNIVPAERLSIGTSYLLSYPVQKADYPPLVVFRNWLLGTLTLR